MRRRCPVLPPPPNQPIITVPSPNLESHAIHHLVPDNFSATPTDHPPHCVNIILDDDLIIVSTVTAPPPHTPIKFELSSNPFGNLVDVAISVKGDHPTLGLEIVQDIDNTRLTLQSCTSSTPAAHIPCWHSALRNGVIIAIDNQPFDNY